MTRIVWAVIAIIGITVGYLSYHAYREVTIQGPPEPKEAEMVRLISWSWEFRQSVDGGPLIVRMRWNLSTGTKFAQRYATDVVKEPWMSRSPKLWSKWVRERGEAIAQQWEE